MSKKIRILLTVCAALLLVVGSVAGTMAWLQDETETITNTFDATLVDIELEESTGTIYDLLPGAELKKDPTVTVIGGSEDCWVFIKIDEHDPKDYISYEVDNAYWTALEDVDGVYCARVKASENNQKLPVLDDNVVVVSEDVCNNVNSADLPSLTFTAYAIQYDADKLNNSAKAWAVLNPTTGDSSSSDSSGT